MAFKEGRCPNCGSLLQLDPKIDQGHCLFCDAVFAAADAYAIAANPAGVTFPNLPQPKYEGPVINPQLHSAQAAAQALATAPSRKKETRPVAPAQPTYVPRTDIKAPVLKLPMKTRLLLIAAAILIIAVIIGISAPAILDRNATRAELYASMGTIAPDTQADLSVIIHGQNNQRLQIALPEAVTAAEAVAIFKAYGQRRAAVDQLDSADFDKTYGDLTLKIVFPTGGYLIRQPDSLAELDDATAVQNLT